MNGVHDVGGMHGFGPVEREPTLPSLEPWEAIVVAINGALRAKGLVNIDEFRHAIERMGAAYYLESPYFEHWLVSFETLTTEKGFVDPGELSARAERIANGVMEPAERVAAIAPVSGGPLGWRRPDGEPPRFAVGERVTTRNVHPAGHTRLARYARGKSGVVHQLRGTCVFPDTNAHLAGEDPQQVYSVRFEAVELWGDSAEAGTSVYIDLWESYLLRAGG